MCGKGDGTMVPSLIHVLSVIYSFLICYCFIQKPVLFIMYKSFKKSHPNQCYLIPSRSNIKTLHTENTTEFTAFSQFVVVQAEVPNSSQ
jgi:hypothetical protein